jgi:ferrous iron transport protein A
MADIEGNVPLPAAAPPTSLAEVETGSSFVVHDVLHPAAALNWPQRLEELGFLPGERVRVLARPAGGEPLSVRVGHSTYALRRQEAACVRVRPSELGR